MEKRFKADKPFCVVLLSGGLDSAVLLAGAVKEFGVDRTVALSVDYGQTHGFAELRAAELIADHYGVRRIQSDTPLGFLTSGLLGTGESPVVPGRNGILLALGAALVVSLGGGYVWIGVNADDTANFPDCGGGFVAWFSRAVEIGTGNKAVTQSPFSQMTKADVVKQGRELGVPLELTVSCYKGVRCGECLACKTRSAAGA